MSTLRDDDDRRWAHVWCDHCHQVQPLTTGYLEAGPDGNAKAGVDLVCSVCGYIIATLHER